jgi:Tol biopolymer transport system component
MNQFLSPTMSRFTNLLFLFMAHFIWSQTNTEVYLVDITSENGSLRLVNPRNISNSIGYDNQPAFLNADSILFSSTRNEQTDIAVYSIKRKKTTWITDTAIGSEYSPLKIPNQNALSAIRLDTTGLQLLYRYDIATGAYTELLKDLKVGYQVWYDEEMLVCTVLVGNGMDLVVSDLKNKTNTTVAKNVGRSLHKIPNTSLVSYISKQEPNWTIRSLDPKTGISRDILFTLTQIEDMCWLSDGTILMPNQQQILQLTPSIDREERVFHNFTETEIKTISRMAVSPDGKHMAIVVDEVP